MAETGGSGDGTEAAERPFIADGIAADAYNEEGVDLTLIRMFLEMTPAERLDAASSSARAIEELRALHSAGR